MPRPKTKPRDVAEFDEKAVAEIKKIGATARKLLKSDLSVDAVVLLIQHSLKHPRPSLSQIRRILEAAANLDASWLKADDE